MCQIYSKYRRKQNNIDKAVFNEEVQQQLQQHYKYLHSKLVHSKADESTFNDTYLKLTYNFNSDRDFVEQFLYYFKLLKGAYYRDNKVEKYHLNSLTGIDIADSEINDSSEKKIIDLNNLKQEIQEYANTKKARKTTYKKD